MLLKHTQVFLAITIAQIMSEGDLRVITTLKYSSQARTRPAVVRGIAAFAGDIPYMVSIKEPIRSIQKASRWTNMCGGSIISKLKVLTAAHCFENNHFYYARYPSILRVVAGELHNDASQPDPVDGGGDSQRTQWRKIRKVIIHKHFHFPENDIAIVIVDLPWLFVLGVDFITPAREHTEYYNILHETNCFVSGYGKVSHKTVDDSSDVLLFAPIKVYSKLQCTLLWEMNMDSFICTDSVISDVSQGDSGGPLACRAGAGAALRLAGVVCGTSYDRTSLFTRVSAYCDWIDLDGSRASTCAASIYVLIFSDIVHLIC